MRFFHRILILSFGAVLVLFTGCGDSAGDLEAMQMNGIVQATILNIGSMENFPIHTETGL